MSKLKSILRQLDRKISALEKPAAAHRDLVVEQVIIVFAVLVWVGAMMLLP